jgi:hypothetical protein
MGTDWVLADVRGAGECLCAAVDRDVVSDRSVSGSAQKPPAQEEGHVQIVASAVSPLV